MTLSMLILSETSLASLFVSTLFVVLVIAGLIGAIAVVRKYITGGTFDDDPAAGFTFAGLRQLVRDGKMTQEEYDKAKAQIVAATQRAAERKVSDVPRAPEPKIRPDDPH